MYSARAVTDESGNRLHIGNSVKLEYVAEWRPDESINWGEPKFLKLGDLLSNEALSMLGYFIQKNHESIEALTLRSPVTCFVAGTYKKVTVSGFDYIQRKNAIKRIKVKND